MVKRVSRNGKGDKGQQSKMEANKRGVAFAPHGHVTAACKDCATRHCRYREHARNELQMPNCARMEGGQCVLTKGVHLLA